MKSIEQFTSFDACRQLFTVCTSFARALGQAAYLEIEFRSPFNGHVTSLPRINKKDATRCIGIADAPSLFFTEHHKEPQVFSK
jgi:hypothetical protein